MQIALHSMMLRVVMLSVVSFCCSCSDDFAPMSSLQRLEVLALVQSPPSMLELNAASLLDLSASLFLEANDSIVEEHWTTCPVSTGAAGGYQCAIAACEKNHSGSLQKLQGNVSDLVNLTCLTPLPTDIASVDLSILYEVKSKKGHVRRAAIELPLWRDASIPEQTSAPSFSEVQINEQDVLSNDCASLPVMSLNQSVPVRIGVTPGKRNGSDVEPLTYLYSSVGIFDAAVGSGKLFETTWDISEYGTSLTEATLYAVARDGNGGQAVWGPCVVKITP